MYDNSAANNRVIPTNTLPSTTVFLEYPKHMYKYDYEYDNENGNDSIIPAIPVSRKSTTFYQSFCKCVCIPIYYCCKYSG
jgi:hypothetical protein